MAAPKLTAKLIVEAVKLQREGLPHKYIALRIGIDETTFSRWLSRGAGDERGLYRQLYLELGKAKAEMVSSHLTALEAAGAEDPRVHQWLLSRLDPSEFGRRDNVPNERPEDRAAQQQATRALLIERLQRLLPSPIETVPALIEASPVEAPKTPSEEKS